MHKNVKRVFAVAILGVGVVVGGAWYVTTGNQIKSTEELISGINSSTRPDGGKVKIAYDQLTRAGFPSVGVRFVNPSVELNTPGLADPNADATITPQPLHLVWKHEGTVDIITNYVKHQYRIAHDGAGSGSIETGGETVGISATRSQIEIVLTAKTSDGFAQWESLDMNNPESVKNAIAQIGGVQVNAGPISMAETTSGKTILTQEAGSFDLTNRSDEKVIDFELAMMVKGSEVTKEYAEIMTQAMTMLRLPTTMIDDAMPLSAVRAGKQDMDIAMKVNLPIVNRGAPMPNGSIHVTKFDIRNDFYTVKAPLDVVLHEDAARRNAAIKLNWTLDVTPAGATEMQAIFDQLLLRSPVAAAVTKEIDATVLREKLLAALPTMSTLGPVNIVLDAAASVPKPGAESAPENANAKESLTLRQFTFAHKRWALEAKGDAARDATKRGSTINATILCKQCSTFTQDTFETARAVQDVMLLAQPNPQAVPLSEQTLQQVNTALTEIGKPGTATGDLDFIITTPAENDVRLNDKPLDEALAKLMMAFMAPPAAAEEVPPPPVAPDPGSPAI